MLRHLRNMDIKLLLSILNRPWFIEPGQAQMYAELAAGILRTGSMPSSDKRKFYGDGGAYGFGKVFRVDEKGTVSATGKVQVIRMNYPVAKYDFCGDPGTQSVQQFIQAANEDDGISSIVLWVDSPGGQVDGTDALAASVKKSAKPIVAYSDGMICSAMYWVSSAAAEIIVHGDKNGFYSSIGSIGTMARWMDMSGHYEKEGVKVHTVFATASKDKWGTFLSANAGNYEGLIQELDEINNTFLSAVKANRSGKIDLSKEDVLTGKTYNANNALKFGLIDKIGDFQFAVKRSLQLARGASNTRNNSQKNTMAKFPKTLAAAKAEQDFEVLNEGIWLNEEQLSNIEASIADSTAQLESAQTAATTAQDTITAHQATIDELTAAANTHKATIASLQSDVARLGKKDDGTFSTSTTDKPDGFSSAEDRANDPSLSMNAAADRILRRR